MMIKYSKLNSIIGISIIVLNILIFSILTPGYSHFWQTISELNHLHAPLKNLMNLIYTLGFAFLSLSTFKVLNTKETTAKISAILMNLSFLIIVFMMWFLPMNPTEGINTLGDKIHTNTITLAVIIFLISQLFLMTFFKKIKNLKSYKYTLFMFALGLAFGILSMYSNITSSELINISERGWMLSFLLFLFYMPDLFENKI